MTKSRAVTLYLHLGHDQLATGIGLAELGTTRQLVLFEQVRQWCGGAGSITIRPVIDLNTNREVTGYQVSPRQHEHIALRDKTCVFPHCTRPAHPIPRVPGGPPSHDADHIAPYHQGGDTSTDNLACLCRLHHILKTHTAWSYQRIGPGEYLWRTPHGHHLLRTTTGTIAVDPPPQARPRAA